MGCLRSGREWGVVLVDKNRDLFPAFPAKAVRETPEDIGRKNPRVFLDRFKVAAYSSAETRDFESFSPVSLGKAIFRLSTGRFF
jgi:hypothetical protein